MSRFGPWAKARATDPDDAALLAVLGSARVLAIGEPGHGAHEPLALRNRIVRLLASRGELGTVALESDIVAGKAVDAWVRGGPGDAIGVVRRNLSYGFGEMADNVDLVRFLRAHNRATGEEVRCFGFDIPGGAAFGLDARVAAAPAHLARLLGALDGDRTRTLREGLDALGPLMRPETTGGLPAQEHGRIDELLARADAVIASHRDALDAADRDGAAWASLLVRNIRGAIGFARCWPRLPDDIQAIPHDLAGRILKASGERDLLMAHNIVWLRDRLPVGKRLVLFAANGHVIGDEHVGGFWTGHRGAGLPAGFHLRRRLGADYRVLLTVSAHPLRATDDEAVGRAFDRAMAGLGRPNALLALDDAPADPLLDEAQSFGTNGPFAQSFVPRRAADAVALVDRLHPAPPSPPDTEQRPVVERTFGVECTDPYRWLEGKLATDRDLREWIERQDRYAGAAFAALPRRAEMRALLETAWSFEKLGAPLRRGERLFFEWNPGLSNHPRIQVCEGEAGAVRTLVDPNALDASGGTVVQDWMPSPDGSTLAYTVQHHGGDWRSLHLLDVATGRVLPDRVERLKAAQFAWGHDGETLWYTAFEPSKSDDPGEVTLDSSVYRHRLGDAQANDRLVYRGASAVFHLPRVSDDGRWLVIASTNGGMNREEIRVQDTSLPDAPLRTLRTGAAQRWNFVGGAADALLFFTDDGAPRGRIVALNPALGSDQAPRPVVAEAAEAIRGVQIAGGQVVVQYAAGIGTALRRFRLDGVEEPPIPLPEGVVVDQLRGSASGRDVFFRLSSMVAPPAVYRFDLDGGVLEPYRAPRAGWNPGDFVVRQITATSADGTQVPITVAHARGLDLSTPKPTVLLAYGGFGISLDMSFAESRFAWVLDGGVFAVAHVRGGAEFGDAWAAAARKAGRLKVVEDYLASARALVGHRFASPRTLVASGASNGGLLVAAAANADPAAFAVVTCRVPVADMLRYTKFSFGRVWIDELGDPDLEDEFRALLSYSPVHNVKDGRRYPPIVVTTAEADDRAVPAHAFKYVATLQNADIGPGPFLLRVERGAGHGQGKPATKLIDEFADLWAFAHAHIDV